MGRKKSEKPIETEMFSVRKDQYDRLTKIADKEKRNRRAVFDRMLDKYECKKLD
jgi:hypothetical protein